MRWTAALPPRRIIAALVTLGGASFIASGALAILTPSLVPWIVVLAAMSVVLVQAALLVALRVIIAEVRASRVEADRAARRDRALTVLAREQELIAQAVRDQLRNDIRTRKVLDELLNEPRVGP